MCAFTINAVRQADPVSFRLFAFRIVPFFCFRAETEPGAQICVILTRLFTPRDERGIMGSVKNMNLQVTHHRRRPRLRNDPVHRFMRTGRCRREEAMAHQTRQMVKIIREICSEHGIAFRSYSHEWILQLSAGQRMMLIYGYKFPNNNAAIEQICNDKAALSDLLTEHGIPHIPHHLFLSPSQTQYIGEYGDWAEMRALLGKYGKIVCKTNSGTGGNGVFKASTPKELEFAAYTVFSKSRAMSVSPFREIRSEYRVIIVNSGVGVIYEKKRPAVTGNGIDSIRRLIDLDDALREVEIDGELDTSRVPAPGETVEVSWKHNLGQGAHPVSVTDPEKQERLSKLAASCAALLGAEFMSIDIVEDECGLEVLEINSGVMMENLAKSGPQNYATAKRVYEKAVLRYLGMDLPPYTVQRPRKSRFVLPILEEIARERGARVIPDKEEGNFSIFDFGNGRRFVARDYPFNINYAGSVSLCTNKAACACFLRDLGFRVPKQKVFVKKAVPEITLAELQRHFDDPENLLGFGFPMILKPNSLSQGTGVCKIADSRDGAAAKIALGLKEKLFLLQEYCPGRDYRIVVLGGRVIQAYERVPFRVEGDGKHTVGALLWEQARRFEETGRDKKVDITDPRILHSIESQGFALDTVLPAGTACRLQDVANLSLGGTTIDRTGEISPFYADLAVRVADSLNLKLCGIDLIAADITDPDSTDYRVIEVNSAPGLDNYVYEGERQEEYVKSLYRMVFDYLESRE